MKKLFLTMVAIAPLLATAQNVMPKEYFSFEPVNGKVGGKIWIQPKDSKQVMVSDEQAADGKYSLKFSCDDFGSDKDKKAQCSTPALVVEEGEYEISVKVFATEKTPKGFNIGLVETSDGSFQNISWKLKDATPGEWTTLTQTKKLKGISKGKITISLSADSRWGGVGTFYLDEMKIVKKTE